MKAVVAPFTAARDSAPPWKVAGLLLASSLIVSSAAAMAGGLNDQSAGTAQVIPAKWVPRKLHFVFTGFTAHYSCDGLQDQMKAILRQLGAGDDLLVRSSGCTHLEGPEPFPGLEATFSVLEPVGGGGQAAAPSQGVNGRWDNVNLDSDTPLRTHTGECELIEQVKQHVLPLFTTRNLTFSSDCFPHTQSLAGTRLRVEVLRPVKPAPPQPAPAAR